MKTIILTDDQFDTLFEFVDQKVESVVERSIDYQDSEILNAVSYTHLTLPTKRIV